MDETASKFYESMPEAGIYDEISAQKSKELSGPMQRMAEETGCLFFDAGPITQTGEDGCHLDLESHKNLADSLFELLSTL